MDQQVGFAGFAQGRAEGGHQLVRQVAHEADGVGQHHVAAGQGDPAHGGVEGGEQLVGGVGVGAGQGVEQRRLAGVGVAHQGHARQLAAHAGAAHLGALHVHLRQPGLELLDALLQQPAVGLELGLAGAAQADRTAALAVQVAPAAHQARGHVLELRQFDLQLAFMAARALGEDVEDQPGAVDHAALEELLQVALLARRQRVVDQHEVGAAGIGRGLDLVELAAAQQGGGIRAVDARRHHVGDARAGRAGEFGELLQRTFVRRAAAMRLDQQRVLALAGTFKQLGGHSVGGVGSCPRHGGAGGRRKRHSASSSIPAPACGSSAACTTPPPGPTRTLRAGTTVEIACL